MVLHHHEQPGTYWSPARAWTAAPFPNSMRLLVVEADPALRATLASAALEWTLEAPWDGSRSIATFSTVVEADSVAEALRRLEEPFDVVIVDLQMSGDVALRVVEHANRGDHAPAILALSGDDRAQLGFQLAKLGVRGCLSKPFTMEGVRVAIEKMLAEPPDLATSARAQVGYRHIHTVQDEVKRAMLERAFRLEGGNITRAARRLGVTRTAVQQMLDRYGLPRSLETPET